MSGRSKRPKRRVTSRAGRHCACPECSVPGGTVLSIYNTEPDGLCFQCRQAGRGTGYDPRWDPDLADWLLRLLRRRRGKITRPLEELRKVGKVCADEREARDAIHGHIEGLRRGGHYIRGVCGRLGGYRYVCGPNDERVSGRPHQR